MEAPVSYEPLRPRQLRAVSPPAEPVTANDLRDALDRHARMTRPRGLSYEEVARNTGSVVIVAGLVWLLIGAPGVPAVEDFTKVEIVPRLKLAGIVFALVVCGEIAGQGLRFTAVGSFAEILRLPMRALGHMINTAMLLCGVAAVGTAALVPGTLVVHLLGLTG